ncbi:MAG: hypothetical protein JWO86_9007 [Myxococcaceae bacterium]|nr:hypothetical protein [Myxococcaceae bacterium]
MDLSRNQFLKLLVFIGAPGALVGACSSSSTPGTAAAGDAGSAGTSGTSGATSGASGGTSGTSGTSGDASTSGTSGTSGSSGTSGTSGGVDASDDALGAFDAPPPDCNAHGATAGTITGNHGHSLKVPVADFADGLQHVYDITGFATHSHTVTLSATDLATVKSGGMVTVTSSINVHMHDVTVVCA